MWPLKRKLKQRRLEVRKSIQTAEGPGRWRRFRTSVGMVPLVLVVTFYVVTVLLDSLPLVPFTHRVGQFVPRDIHARVRFVHYPPHLFDQAKEKARQSAPVVFVLDEAYFQDIVTALKGAPDLSEATTQPASSVGAVEIPPDRLEDWAPLLQADRRSEYDARVAEVGQRLVGLIVVAPEQQDPELYTSFRVLIDAQGARTERNRLTDFIGTSQVADIADGLDTILEPIDEAIRPEIKAYLSELLTTRPLYRHDVQASEWETQRRVDAVAKPTVMYAPGERLVQASLTRPKGDRRGLTSDEYDLLKAEHGESRLQERQVRPWRLWMRFVGRGMMLLVLTMILAAYVYHYRRRVITNHLRALAMTSLLLLMLTVSKGMVMVMGWSPYVAVLPVLMATIILVIAYDQRFALGMGLLLSMFVGLQLRATFAIYLILPVAAASSAMLLRDIRSRSRLIEVAGMVAAVIFAATFGLGMAHGVGLSFILQDASWAAGMALLVGFIVQGILPLIERGFNIATSMTLLEWCDASKPLLKRLAMEAPGTYNHSLQLGTMCEAAADSIGANGLLARVGAYYHDIGKINKPKYFVENRDGVKNLHDGLSPEMSMLIIAGHVKDGCEMAREYNLPGVLHEFIASHHGTTVVQYFYHAATEQRRNGADRMPADTDFRYPGPKPYSKEAGILMLSDAAESSVRAMPDPTPSRIENQVHTMVNRRLMDGQLDECELRLQEVHAIEQSLIKSLCAIYHARIAYPKPSDDEGPAAPADQPT